MQNGTPILIHLNAKSSNYYPILYKMETVNRTSAFQIYQKSSDAIAKRTKLVSENSEPIKSDYIKFSEFILVM